jgi:gamma-glutamyl hydrolase
MAYLVTKINL